MATIREFNGERFYLKSSGHYRNPHSALHRRVWEAYNGPIPAGMHVHHIDHDPSNNEIENLALMQPSAHHSLHNADPALLPEQLDRIAYARQVGNTIDVPGICEQCSGKMFGARKAATRNDVRRKRFCSRKCASRSDYLRRIAKKES